MISVHVKPFARYREIISKNMIIMELPKSSSVSDLLADLILKFPELKPYEGIMVVAIKYEYQEHNYVLRDDDEVALIPPVSGGK